jgi:hypothetical protein
LLALASAAADLQSSFCPFPAAASASAPLSVSALSASVPSAPSAAGPAFCCPSEVLSALLS